MSKFLKVNMGVSINDISEVTKARGREEWRNRTYP